MATASSHAPEGFGWRRGAMRHLWEAIRWGRSSSMPCRQSGCDSPCSSTCTDGWGGDDPGSPPVQTSRMGTKCSTEMPALGAVMRKPREPAWRTADKGLVCGLSHVGSARQHYGGSSPVRVRRSAPPTMEFPESQAQVSLVLSTVTDPAEASVATAGSFAQRPAAKGGSAAFYLDDELLLQVHVRRCFLKALAWVFDVELTRIGGGVELQLQRALVDFERIHLELNHAFTAVAGRKLQFPRVPARFSPLAMSKQHLQELCTEKAFTLQQWFDDIISAQLAFKSDALVSTLQLPGVVRHWAAQREPNLLTLVDCYQPIFDDIVDYLAETPRHLVRFTSRTCKRIAEEVGRSRRPLWEQMYRRRWPPFYASKTYQGIQNWRCLYKDTLNGKVECTLEVFDREKKPGFAMAAMVARITYDKVLNNYVARYISVSDVPPEPIPVSGCCRLRFCPESVRGQLRPGGELSETLCCSMKNLRVMGVDRADLYSRMLAAYPYSVLQGISGLTVGQGVELQWKMQFGSPFGWWFAHLEALEKDIDNERATATITFTHFPETSRWYRLRVRFGDAEIRPCSFGGYTGGIRPVTPEEQRHWMSFFPREPVRF